MRRGVPGGCVLLCALAAVVSGCGPGASADDPFAGRARTRFDLALLLPGDASPGLPSRPLCAVPIRGEVFDADLAPEVGLVATLSVAGQVWWTDLSNVEGRAALVAPAPGFVRVELVSGDGLLRGLLNVEIDARRVWLRGRIAPDETDRDGDGRTGEWALQVEALPDADLDGVSDTGRRGAWHFERDRGVAWWHGGDGRSERAEIDLERGELEAIVFADRDGDLVADDADGDADGDALIDATEGAQLPCPGFSHDDLQVPDSAHQPLPCSACHDDADPPALRCLDCHAPGGRRYGGLPDTTPAAHFERRCEQCHAVDQAWVDVPGPEGEQHLTYPLTGRHLAADCFGCHVTGNIEAVPERCADCHLGDAPPRHALSDCDACHTTAGWTPSLYTHEGLPLIGGHAALACLDCHQPDTFLGLSAACASCHLDDAPVKHIEPGFDSQPCEACHSVFSWSDYSYLHPLWPLRGKHLMLTCEDCHQDNPTGYTGLRPDCAACHAAPAFPDHAELGQDCITCHSEEGWVPALSGSFDHSAWPLVGSHLTAACGSCHQDGALLQPPTSCSACHQGDRPTRHAGVFEGECDLCHQPSRWADLIDPYQHSPTFPLEGVHASLRCSDCHASAYQIPTDCASCHRADAPEGHYGDECGSCHTPASWSPTDALNYHTISPGALPLTGGHAALRCADCHIGGIGPLTRACEACHTSDIPAGHALAACAGCHTPVAWASPTHPTANALHPLVDGHSGVVCSACHGVYTSGAGFTAPRPDPACGSCHPLPADHVPVRGLDCDACHDVGGWSSVSSHRGPLPTAPFDYAAWSAQWFPIEFDANHGAIECGGCHTRLSTGGELAYFSCTTACHQDQERLDRRHNQGEDSGGGLSHQFHLYHYDPLEQNTPPDEGGAPWPTGHTGCVNLYCHPGGSLP